MLQFIICYKFQSMHFHFESFRVQCDGVRFARQCLGLNVIDTLQRSASTVQSYFGIPRNISESQFQIAGNCWFDFVFGYLCIEVNYLIEV